MQVIRLFSLGIIEFHISTNSWQNLGQSLPLIWHKHFYFSRIMETNLKLTGHGFLTIAATLWLFYAHFSNLFKLPPAWSPANSSRGNRELLQRFQNILEASLWIPFTICLHPPVRAKLNCGLFDKNRHCLLFRLVYLLLLTLKINPTWLLSPATSGLQLQVVCVDTSVCVVTWVHRSDPQMTIFLAASNCPVYF